MPHVYFEPSELTHCPWCGSPMVRSIVEVLCVDCSMHFTERLHPQSLWKEPTALPVSTCDKDFGDSAYEHSDTGTSTRAMDTREHTVVADTGGSSSSSVFEMVQQVTMYDKLTDALRTLQGPFQLEEDLWIEFVRSDSLSKCWVSVAGGGLVQLALPEFQCLSRYFTVEAPMGFLVINCMTRTSFHVDNLGNVDFCGMRSACHYLRSYPRQCIGFVLARAEEGHDSIAIAQCATTERVFRDRYWFYAAQALLDRMMKIIISRYDHVAFRRAQTK